MSSYFYSSLLKKEQFMLLPHSYFKHLQKQSDFAQKHNKIISIKRKNNLNLETLIQTSLSALYNDIANPMSAKSKFEDEFLQTEKLMDFLEKLKRQMFVREQKELCYKQYKLKEDTVSVFGKNNEHLCDLVFVFFEDVFHVYLTCDHADKEKLQTKFAKPIDYSEEFELLQSYKFFEDFLENYNFNTNKSEKVIINDEAHPSNWLQEMILAGIYVLSQTPTLYLGKFKVGKEEDIYQKISSIFYTNKLNKNVGMLEEVIDVLAEEFYIWEDTLDLFKLFYFIKNSKTVSGKELNNYDIVFLNSFDYTKSRKVREAEKEIRKLNGLMNSAKYIEGGDSIVAEISYKILENQGLIEKLNFDLEKNQSKEDVSNDFNKILQELSNEGKDNVEYIKYLKALRTMNLLSFKKK